MGGGGGGMEVKNTSLSVFVSQKRHFSLFFMHFILDAFLMLLGGGGREISVRIRCTCSELLRATKCTHTHTHTKTFEHVLCIILLITAPERTEKSIFIRFPSYPVPLLKVLCIKHVQIFG